MRRRLNRSPNPTNDRPLTNYQSAGTEPDPFPDLSLLDPLDSKQHSDLCTAVWEIVDAATRNGIPTEH